MDIWYVTKLDPNLPHGGAQHVLSIAHHLAGRGHRVSLFSAGRSPLPEMEDCSVPLPIRGAVRSLAFEVLLLGRLLGRGLRRRPDALYARTAYVFLAPVVASILLRRPLLVEVNGWSRHELPANGAGRLKRLVAAVGETLQIRASRVAVAVTEQLAERLADTYGLGPGRVAVVPNGADTDRHRPLPKAEARREVGAPTDRPLVLFVGRLMAHQDLETLLAAMEGLTAEGGPAPALWILGDGPRAPWLRQAVADRRLESVVRLVGSVSPAEVPRYVAAADLCVAPLDPEYRRVTGFGSLKVFDTMACGRRMVVTRVPGNDFLGDFPAISLVPPADPEAFAAAIRHQLNRVIPGDDCCTELREYVLQYRDWQAVAARIEKLVADAVAAPAESA